MAPTREVRSRHVGIFKVRVVFDGSNYAVLCSLWCIHNRPFHVQKLGRYASSDAELTEQEFQALVRMIAAKEYRVCVLMHAG